jgi:hypothetical protein
MIQTSCFLSYTVTVSLARFSGPAHVSDTPLCIVSGISPFFQLWPPSTLIS